MRRIKIIIAGLTTLYLVCIGISYPIMAYKSDCYDSDSNITVGELGTQSSVLENNLDTIISEGNFDKEQIEEIHEDIDIISDAGLSSVNLIDINKDYNENLNYTIEFSGIQNTIVVNSDKDDSSISLTVTEGEIVNKIVLTDSDDFILDDTKVLINKPQITIGNATLKDEKTIENSQDMHVARTNPFVLISHAVENNYSKETHILNYNPYPTIANNFKVLHIVKVADLDIDKRIVSGTMATAVAFISWITGYKLPTSIVTGLASKVVSITFRENPDEVKLSLIYKEYIPKQGNPFYKTTIGNKKRMKKKIFKYLTKRTLVTYDKTNFKGNSISSTDYLYEIVRIGGR